MKNSHSVVRRAGKIALIVAVLAYLVAIAAPAEAHNRVGAGVVRGTTHHHGNVGFNRGYGYGRSFFPSYGYVQQQSYVVPQQVQYVQQAPVQYVQQAEYVQSAPACTCGQQTYSAPVYSQVEYAAPAYSTQYLLAPSYGYSYGGYGRGIFRGNVGHHHHR